MEHLEKETVPEELAYISVNQDSIKLIPQQKEKGILSTKFDNDLISYVNKYEFIILNAIGIIVVVYTTIDLAIFNQELREKNEIIGLQQSWFETYKDHNDPQWRSVRDNLFEYVIFLIGFLMASNIIKSTRFNNFHQNKPLQIFNIIIGLGLLIFLVRSGIIIFIVIAGLQYCVASFLFKFKYYVHIVWVMNLSILFMCKSSQIGVSYFSFEFPLIDSIFGHPLAKWDVVFNLTVLRMTSFCIDKSWAHNFHSGGSKQNDKFLKTHIAQCDDCKKDKQCLKNRQETHLMLNQYNLLNYCAYLLYVPLFVAGPITTFNAWCSQIYVPQMTHNTKQKIMYAIRVFFDYICFELFLHLFYANSLSTNARNHHLWSQFSIRRLTAICFYELHFLWLKFVVIWRIPRAVALFDDMEVPENMNRCMMNNNCFEGFWRSWHRGFNQWLIRYIFIPLGGRHRKVFNIWVVFTYVALWHDFELNLVLWAWCICLCLMPEIVLKSYFTSKKMQWIWKKWYFKYVCIYAAGFVIIMMVLANLIGFGFGQAGISYYYQMLQNSPETWYQKIYGALGIFFSCSILTFTTRHIEAVYGAKKNF